MENEDLGIVTKTKNEIFWEKVKGESEKEVERLREGIIFHEAVSKLAEEKIALEKS